ncbi:ATP-grasp domain-containing protein [Saccharicrinis sp. 156]|uniref:ATP-grasp domain-containing protein n=1 Tax=Saccharicrinis sp. 156 TaxID=3417574 RepID=UPI003D3571BE
MQKKCKSILVLPALFDHVDLIKEAKRNGYQVITCDNNPYNVGHQFSDKFVNISLLDHEGLLRFAKDNNIDAVAAYSTDIGAISASYIAEKMNLVGNVLDSVVIMANKSRFRAFLKENDFLVPSFQVVVGFEEINLENLRFPLIVKPIDRSGSKGVHVVKNIQELKNKIGSALRFSIEKKVIVEEFIDTGFKQIHGDALVQNGELKFCCLGDQYFGEGHLHFAPVATTFPSFAPDYLLRKIEDDLRRFLKLVGYANGGINIEIRIDKEEKVYFIELAPRFGGNYIPKVISRVCNLNLIRYAFDIAVGNKVVIPKYKIDKRVFQFILRSKECGVFKSVSIQSNSFFNILNDYPIKKPGESISHDDVVSSIISVYNIQVRDLSVIDDVIYETEKYFNIELTIEENKL